MGRKRTVRASRRRRLFPIGTALLCTTYLTACGPRAPSTLDPHGPGARTIATLWWFMFAVSAAVVLLVGVLHRRRSDLHSAEPRWSHGLIFGGGVIFPLLVLTVLWVWSLHDMAAL